MLKKGEWVWLESSIGVSIGARVKVTKTGQQVLVDDEGKEHIVPQGGEAAIRVMHPTSVEGVEDMIRLGDLNEAGLLRNLMLRHKQSNIYTYTGSVLVAVNPYQELPLYTAEQVRLYHGRRLGELPPHVFAIADTCYFNMRRFKRNQCCIISGESGAGKTESTKLMLQFLAAVSGQHSWIEQQILEANPILEAFGNAKTIRNDNSSRFGKYVEIFFNKDGVIEGAKMEQYLLEKSRVCHQAIQERNYHIFYCMLAGMSEEQKKTLSLGDATDFNFLTQGDCIVCEGRDDAKDYARLRSALRILTFTDSQCWGIFTLLTALLHLGNINFKATILDNMEHSDISKSDHFTIAAKLLEVQSKALEVSLTQRSFLTNTERVSKPLSSEQALDCRDAFVKAIYGKLFIWIVGKINNTIHKIPMNGPKYVRNSIGLLDIFGFENFDSNSFEQLCINFANEQLQQFFVNHMFKEEQDEYSKEEIVWKNVSFDDNQSTLDLLAGKSLNLLSLIDEESHFPKGTDATMLNKMNTVHGKSNIYLSSKSAHDVEFGIHHFAGVVYYNSKGFLEKNRDAVSSDIIKLIDMSTNKLLRMIFETELNSNRAKISNNQRVVITPKSSLRAHSDGRKQVTTLSGQFRTSLDALMKTLSVCQPFFIRCFKPNDDKQSKSFDRELCIRQLRYSGMMDTIRIRKLGFPIRHSFKDFLQRYRVLLNTTVCDPQTETAAACCDAICRAVITGDDGWRIGKTKIFLKDAHDSFLEQEREREFNRKALIIQRIMLGHRDRKSFVNKRRAAVVVQTYWRAYRVQKINRKILCGFERLISRVRGRKAQLEFRKKQKAAISMQARVRGSLARKSFKRQRQAVTLLQAHARGMLVRKKTNKIRTATFLSAQEHQAQKQESLELQRRLEEVVRQSQQASSSPEPTDEEGIEDMFNFLPTVAAQAQPERPSSYVVEKKKEEENKEKDEEKQTELQEKQTELEKKIKPEQTETKPEEKETKQEEKETKLEEKETKQEEKEIKLEEKETKLEEKETKQEEKETKLEEKETKLEEKETKLEEKETKLEEKETKLEEKETKSKPEDKALLVTITEAPELDTVSDPSLQELPVEDYNSDDEEDHSADDEYSFFKFSAMHFQGSASNSHINQRLRQPLLHHEDEGDALACLTVWWIILRFMGDLPEPKNSSHECFNSISNSSPQYAMRQGRRLSHLVGLDQKVLRKNRRKSEVAGSNRKHSTVVEESENEVNGNDILIGEGPTLDRPLSSLDKLHVIVGYAISRPNIRDEIYCQICKQLIKNKNKRSCLRGWILMSICLGVFPPSERLLEYLESFIRRGHKSYGPYCAERLRRIVANGERREPPCYIELKAAKSKTPVLMSVSLMDGSSVSLTVDSASTSAELCGQVAEKINLKDTYGFSIYIDVYEKLWSLGSGGKHVMDAVCQCEQEVRRKGDEELPTLWKLSFQKELFSPWHDSMQDPVSTDIIYQQVIRGLKSKKYSSEKEDDFVQLAAMHYYAQFGSENSSENARKVMEDCIPIHLIETKSQTKWIQMINAAHIQSSYVKVKESKEKAKADVVDSARQKWPIYFSKFYEVTMISGPSLPKSSFIAAINWKGVSFQDNKDKQLLELTYPTVNAANIASDGITGSQSLSLDTMQGLYLLRCNLAGEMAELIQMYLDGLKERSVYAVALQDVNRPDDPTFLSCKRGDLLVIVKDGEYSPEHIWIKGTNERTANTGAITTDAIQVLPTLAKPNEDILKLFSLNQDQKKTKNILEKDDTVAPVSLKEFSFEYFRQPGKEAGRPGQVKRKEKLWVISREPLKQPLLKSLEGNSDLSHMACTAFIAILKYMGDYPNKHIRSAIELTDQIFGPATQYVELQDEIYCQIMRQMTNNSNRISTDYGWQLMWLCTGLFPPSRALVKHTQHFLESRPREPLATDCLQRLQTMLSLEPRKLPPHQVEIDAIRQNSSQIFHKVHFPNETAELFEVESTTRIRDLCRTIASRLQLSSSEGFGLFMKTTNKVMGLNEHDYFFDSLRPTAEQPKKGKKSKEGTGASAPYLVLFMRKLWFNVTPGRDLIADLNFHFPQEMPKYLRGYHKCTKEDVIRLAGLLFRVKVDTDKSQFVMIPRMLKELVPANQLKSMSPEEWKKHIISSYNKQAGITVDEAKVAFLRIISSWPTFGCAFFEVKQTSEPSYPSIVMIAISKQGVNFIDPKTKEFLVLYPFNRITNWSSGSTFFHMTVGNLVKGNNILCETSLGYKMDDLLTSYFNMYESQRMAVQPMTQMFKTQY